LRPLGQAADLALQLRPRLTNAATRWLGSERCTRRILAACLDVREFTATALVSRGQRRVIRVDTSRGQFVLYPSLRRSYVRKLVWAFELSRSHGVPVVPVVGSDSSLLALLRYGAYFALFEFVSGTQLERNCSQATLREVAQLFARLHSVGLEGALAGSSGLPSLAPGRSLAALVPRWERLLSTASISRDDPEVEAVRRRLLEAIPARSAASLVHGDAHLKNLIVKPDGKVVLLDLEGMERGLPLLELVFLLAQLGSGDPARRAAFLECYLAGVHDAIGRDWREDVAFWLLAGHLQLFDQQLEILTWSEKFGDPAYTGRMREVCESTWKDLRTGAYENWTRH
jgi:aminoglycoside phosphotransferase (APT) family kinase protein